MEEEEKSIIAYCSHASCACIQLRTVLFFTNVLLFGAVIMYDGTLTINVFYWVFSLCNCFLCCLSCTWYGEKESLLIVGFLCFVFGIIFGIPRKKLLHEVWYVPFWNPWRGTYFVVCWAKLQNLCIHHLSLFKCHSENRFC